MSRASNMNNLNYYFGGNRGYDTVYILTHEYSRPEVVHFQQTIKSINSATDWEKWCTSTERPISECWHDTTINAKGRQP